MKNFKWSNEPFDSKPVNIVLFASRNKDNKTIADFKERRESFITHKPVTELYSEFKSFVNKGVYGEMSRMYYSVNTRDPKKIYHQFILFLFENPNFNLCSLMSKLASISAKKECAAEKKWMFDFDINDDTELDNFIDDIKSVESINPSDIHPYKSPNGWNIVVDHGFDSRQLMEKYKDKEISLNRDGMICAKWERKI